MMAYAAHSGKGLFDAPTERSTLVSKKNRLIIGLTLLIIVLVAVAAIVVPQQRTLFADAPALGTDNGEVVVVTPEQETITVTPMVTDAPTKTPAEAPTEEPTATEASTEAETAEATDAPTETVKAASVVQEPKAYLLVIIGDAVYQPVPLTGDGDYTVTQKAIGAENKIHVTAESIQMSSANCDNQDCVDQGEVSLSNREERLLGNMIICLPNNVTLELLTPAEAEELIAQANAQQ